MFTITFSSGPSNCSDGDIRLMGGENELEGRVEICYNGDGGQSATMAGMKEMQLLSVTSLDLENQV